MNEMLAAIMLPMDAALAAFLSPLLRALFWGLVTGAVSMAVYAFIAPQERLRQIKAEQKANKAVLKAYDGDFDGLKTLIFKDLGCSMKQVGLSIVPFIISMIPAFGIMFGLETAYMDVALPQVGAEWTGCFEFWYILSAIVSSLVIKVAFKIT